MRKLLVFSAIGFACVACSCSDNKKDAKEIAPGIVLAADSIRIQEDALNELYFSATLETTEGSDSGRYHITAAWGYNAGGTDVTLPKNLETATPALRRDTGYTFIMGFRTAEDSSFHDYFRIAAEDGNLKMRYIKAYFFQ